jgi:L-lactate dehydrogenase complex protein LldF
MSAVATTSRFKENAHEALTDARLQGALVHARNFTVRRMEAAERLPEFEALRDSARAIKDHTLAHLDLYLEAYERKVVESGG